MVFYQGKCRKIYVNRTIFDSAGIKHQKLGQTHQMFK